MEQQKHPFDDWIDDILIAEEEAEKKRNEAEKNPTDQSGSSLKSTRKARISRRRHKTDKKKSRGK